MKIDEMNLEEVEARLAEIESEVETKSAEECSAVTEEVVALNARKAELEAAEQRAKTAEALNDNTINAQVIEQSTPIKEERTMFGIETKEYRDAFMANLVNNATAEQRSILADNSAYGDGYSLPTALDQQIWDQVYTAHPILADVNTINAGMPIKVTKATPAAITKKKDSDASTEQTINFVEVTLVGADYHTYVTLSYAEAKMSQGAMEKYLVSEISDAIGEALAKDVFARIISDATTSQKVDSATVTDVFEQVKAALAKATKANAPVVYAPASSYYAIIGYVKEGAPFNAVASLGAQVKLDNAATNITVVDPSKFVLDMVQSTMIESERDTKNAQIVIGGYCRAEGCLRVTKAAAYVG